MTRNEYEKKCSELNVKSFSDDEILEKDYIMQFGDFHMDHYTKEYTDMMETARERYQTLKQKTQTTVAEEMPEFVETVCDCGHKVYFKELVMTTSFGTSCPDCYDKMSQ